MMNKPRSNWKRRKAREDHTVINTKAIEIMRENRKLEKSKEKVFSEETEKKPNGTKHSDGFGSNLHRNSESRRKLRQRIARPLEQSIFQRKRIEIECRQQSEVKIQHSRASKRPRHGIKPGNEFTSQHKQTSRCWLHNCIHQGWSPKFWFRDHQSQNWGGCHNEGMAMLRNKTVESATATNNAKRQWGHCIIEWTSDENHTGLSKRGQHDTTEYANSVYELPNQEQVVSWYHAAAGYPTKSTWLKAIESGFFATWPLLTTKAVRRHFPESKETSKGHMRRVKSGVRSTKEQAQEHPEIQEAEATLAELRCKHHDVYLQIRETSELAYTDQTGRFPVVSGHGDKYI